MNLKITFITTSGKHKVALTQGEPGLDMVEDMRAEVQLISKLPLSRLNIVCPLFGGHYTIEDIDEKLAASWNTFRAKTSVPIFIPEGYLGRYLKFAPEFQFCNDGILDKIRGRIYKQITGCLRTKDKATVYTELNHTELLADWAKEGNPQYWGITEKQYLEAMRKHFTHDWPGSCWLKTKLDKAGFLSYWPLLQQRALSLKLLYRDDNDKYFLSEEEAKKYAEHVRLQEKERQALKKQEEEYAKKEASDEEK